MTVDIEIEHKYYHKFLELYNGSRGQAVLSPIEKGQKRAVIKFFVTKGNSHTLLTEYSLELSRYSAPEPKIEISAVIKKGKLLPAILIDGEPLPAQPVNVRKYLKRDYRLPVFMLLIGMAAVLSFLAFRILRQSHVQIDNPVTVENSAADKQESIQTPSDTGTAEIPATGTAPEVRLEQTTVYFFPNSSILKDGETRKLDNTAAFLIRHPEVKVTIEGHCAFYGTKEGRMRISRLRAQMIRDYLIGKGWKPDETPELKWYGALKPVTVNPEEKDKNRRVEITLKQTQ